MTANENEPSGECDGPNETAPDGAAPTADRGEALRAERTPVGKKRVTRSNCEETFDYRP